jgi:pyroglutamyl-peptidase
MIPPNRAPARFRLLITGFGAFPGARTNPTLEIASRLARSRRAASHGVDIISGILPVVYSGVEQRLAELTQRVRPDAILHLGLAGRRREMSVETRALNRLSTLRPDAARGWPSSSLVHPAGPLARRSRWSPERLAVVMRKTGAPTKLSIDAGDYLCNHVLYLTLATTGVPAGFIHVPRPRGRRSSGFDERPTLPAMTRAIEAAVLELARCARASKGFS